MFRAAFNGTLVVGTDGLFKYAKLSSILNAASLEDVERVADALVDAARLPSGGRQDDVGVAVVRA